MATRDDRVLAIEKMAKHNSQRLSALEKAVEKTIAWLDREVIGIPQRLDFMARSLERLEGRESEIDKIEYSSSNGGTILERLDGVEKGMAEIKSAIKQSNDSATGRGMILSNIEQKVVRFPFSAKKRAAACAGIIVSFVATFFGGFAAKPAPEPVVVKDSASVATSLSPETKAQIKALLEETIKEQQDNAPRRVKQRRPRPAPGSSGIEIATPKPLDPLFARGNYARPAFASGIE